MRRGSPLRRAPMNMKTPSWALAPLLLLVLPSCIYVRVKGDLDEIIEEEDDDLARLSRELGSCLSEASYELDACASLWGAAAEWTVSFAEAGSDPEAAFQHAKEAVLHHVHEERGHVVDETGTEGTAWSCSFHIDGEPGKASIALVDDAEDALRPRQLVIRWRQSN